MTAATLIGTLLPFDVGSKQSTLTNRHAIWCSKAEIKRKEKKYAFTQKSARHILDYCFALARNIRDTLRLNLRFPHFSKLRDIRA